MARNIYWSFVKEFLLYSMIGFIMAFVSSLWIMLGLVNEAASFLGRSRNNWLGLFGSYFVHKNWSHLLSNTLSYMFFTFLAFVYSSWLRDYPLIGWKTWNLIEIVLMPIIGIFDLYSTDIYSFITSSTGMSDFVLSIGIGSLTIICYDEFKNDGRIFKFFKSRFLRFVWILLMYLLFVERCRVSLFSSGTNIFAHMSGIISGTIVYMIVFTLLKKDFRLILKLFIIFLSIIISIWYVNVIYKA
ncbi:MAG TPA: hypothetical protein ENG40_01335 [Thermoprotei archaeon]|nr:hypothetical protein [Thermoprotei archaeon]